MISGRDIHLEGFGGGASLDFAVRTVRQFWPDLCFEFDGRAIGEYRDIYFPESGEVFVYRANERRGLSLKGGLS